VLFREREHAQRERQPDDAEHRGPHPIGLQDRATHGGNERERQEADQDADERDAARRDGLEAFGHEQKRCAPDEAGENNQQRIDHGRG
jgi:hypothetical protein